MTTLAENWGLTDLKGYVPTAVLLTAFAAGSQVTFIIQGFGDASYPPSNQGWLTWATLAVLAASAILHVPWSKLGQAASSGELSEVTQELKPNRHRQVLLAPNTAPTQPSPSPGLGGEHTNGQPTQAAPVTTVPSEPKQSPPAKQANQAKQPGPADQRPRLKARVHSPLAAGPVVKPGDDIPITVEAEPKELAQELEVTITVDGPDGQRKSTARMEDTTLVHTERFESAGAFNITITLDHPRADQSSKRIDGRVASYREEVARIFEELKERAGRLGLSVGPHSTPREVCRALRTVKAASPEDLAALAVELETALYGDQEVERSTYETVYTTVRRLSLDTQEVPG